MSRPRTDRLALVERLVDALAANPELAARPGELRAVLGARDQDVRRVLCAVRRLPGVELPQPCRGRPKKALPNSGSGS